MDEAVINYYRHLLKDEFPNSGELEHPSIFVEAVGEKLINCGNTGNYMQLYLNVVDKQIIEIKYLCSCEPVANIAVEILCSLLKGRTIDEAVFLTEEPFIEILQTRDERFQMKVHGVLELLKEGLASYSNATNGKDHSEINNDKMGQKISWDGTQSL